jgi:hypothetical protein
LKKFFIGDRRVKRMIPVWVDVGEWKVLLFPEVIKKSFINRSECSPIMKVRLDMLFNE